MINDDARAAVQLSSAEAESAAAMAAEQASVSTLTSSRLGEMFCNLPRPEREVVPGPWVQL